MKINNKILKFFGGNYSHPRPYTKKHTNLPDDFGYEEVPNNFKEVSKKKKRNKKKWVFEWAMCPFCHNSLEVLENKSKLWGREYSKSCKCGAKVVEDCPACHRDTWFKDGIYQHQCRGCGFIGERKTN